MLPKRCVDLDEDQIDEGLKSVANMRRLLEHMARIAKPSSGAAKILVAISRISTTACEWLEGTLHVEVDELIGATEIRVMSDLGGGMRELIFPRLFMAVEYEELVGAVKLAPRLIWPLKSRVQGDCMTLTRETPGTIAPPAFEIAEESLRRSLPPKLRNSLPPIRPAAPRTSEVATVEGAILARVFPKTVRTLVIQEATDLEMGWDSGAYSSGLNTRETKPPPPAKTPSKMPTQPPVSEKGAKRAKDPKPTTAETAQSPPPPRAGAAAPSRASKAPRRTSTKPSAKPSKLPPNSKSKSARPQPPGEPVARKAGARPAIRKKHPK